MEKTDLSRTLMMCDVCNEPHVVDHEMELTMCYCSNYQCWFCGQKSKIPQELKDHLRKYLIKRSR